MIHIENLTVDELRKVYRKELKEKLIDMLIENNKLLGSVKGFEYMDCRLSQPPQLTEEKIICLFEKITKHKYPNVKNVAMYKGEDILYIMKYTIDNYLFGNLEQALSGEKGVSE